MQNLDTEIIRLKSRRDDFKGFIGTIGDKYRMAEADNAKLATQEDRLKKGISVLQGENESLQGEVNRLTVSLQKIKGKR